VVLRRPLVDNAEGAVLEADVVLEVAVERLGPHRGADAVVSSRDMSGVRVTWM